MVAATRTFVMGYNRPTNRRTRILEMVAWTRIRSTRWSTIATHTSGCRRIIRRVRRGAASGMGRTRRHGSHRLTTTRWSRSGRRCTTICMNCRRLTSINTSTEIIKSVIARSRIGIRRARCGSKWWTQIGAGSSRSEITGLTRTMSQSSWCFIVRSQGDGARRSSSISIQGTGST